MQQQFAGNTAGKAKMRDKSTIFQGERSVAKKVGGCASLTSGVIDHEGVHSPRYSL